MGGSWYNWSIQSSLQCLQKISQVWHRLLFSLMDITLFVNAYVIHKIMLSKNMHYPWLPKNGCQRSHDSSSCRNKEKRSSNDVKYPQEGPIKRRKSEFSVSKEVRMYVLQIEVKIGRPLVKEESAVKFTASKMFN